MFYVIGKIFGNNSKFKFNSLIILIEFNNKEFKKNLNL